MKLVLFIHFLCLLCFANGQIVNIENQRLTRKDTGLVGTIGLDVNIMKNTKEIWQIGNKTHLQLNKLNSTYLFLSEIEFAQIDNNSYLSKGFQHIRFNKYFSKLLVGEAFTQLQYNHIQKLKLRWLGGSGIRMQLIKKDSLYANWGVSGMYEYEELTDNSTFSRLFRFSSYLSFNYQLNKLLNNQFIIYYQPVVQNFSDYRVSLDLQLSIQITKKLQFITTYNHLYDSNPPKNVSNHDFSIKNGIKYAFN